jgi:hypothetical protein
MNFTKTLFALTLGSTAALTATSTLAFTLNNGDILSITAGVPVLDGTGNVTNVSPGSYFAMDTDSNSKVDGFNKVPLSQGTAGIVIGATTTAGASHAGAPVGGDTGTIDAPWLFNTNTGTDFVTVGITGSTEAGLDLSGWNVSWNAIAAIPMTTGAWQPLNCAVLGCTGTTFTNGIADFDWSGVYGDPYTLNYAATVPIGDASGFGGTQYYLHFEGTVTAAPVPEAETYILTLAGLGVAGFMASRRKKKTG